MNDGKPKVSLKRQPFLSAGRWQALVFICLSLLTLAGLNIAYTSYVDDQRHKAERQALAAVQAAEREADRRWCALLSTLDDAYRQAPPTSPVGVALAREVRALILSTGC